MKKIITTILLGVFCLSLCACNAGEVVTDVVEEVTQSEEVSKKTYTVGEKAEIDNIAITMSDVYESKGEAYLEPADGNVFVICEFNIENNSTEELNVSSMLNFEAYCDDFSCDLSISALASNNDKKQLDGTVAAGKKLSGVVGYEVPADWSSIEIRYQSDILKDNKVIFVANK